MLSMLLEITASNYLQYCSSLEILSTNAAIVSPIHDKVKEITEFMFEKRKATRVLEYSPEILLYPESDDDVRNCF